MARSSSPSVGFSLDLKIVLILALVVIWNVQGAPSGSEVKEGPSVEVNSDPVLQPESLMKLRQRRSMILEKRNAAGDMEMTIANDTKGMEKGGKKIPDGFQCGSGAAEEKGERFENQKKLVEAKLSSEQIEAGHQAFEDILKSDIGKPYHQSCASGKCRYYKTKFQLLCRSSSIQPMTILIGMLLGFSVFRMLNIDCSGN